MCLTETFLDSSFDYSDIFLDYVKFHAPGKKISHHGRNSGGVLLLVRKVLEKCVKEIKMDCDNTIAIQINKDVFDLDKDVILIACYVPPEKSPSYDDKLLKDGILTLEETLLQRFEKNELNLMIIGDMNARTGHEQADLEVMSNYLDDVEYDCMDDEICERSSKDEVINNFGRSLQGRRAC